MEETNTGLRGSSPEETNFAVPRLPRLDPSIRTVDSAVLRHFTSANEVISQPFLNGDGTPFLDVNGTGCTIDCVPLPNSFDRKNLFEIVGGNPSLHPSTSPSPTGRFLSDKEDFPKINVAGGTEGGIREDLSENPLLFIPEQASPDVGVPVRGEQNPPMEVAQISQLVEIETLREWCGTKTNVTLRKQSDTSDHIKDTFATLILKIESFAATGIPAFFGIITINGMASMFLGLAVCFGMGKVYIVLEGRYLEAWRTRKREEIIFWFTLRQYFKSYYLASLILIGSIMVWNGIHRNNLHKKVKFIEYDLPHIPVTDLLCALPFLSRV